MVKKQKEKVTTVQITGKASKTLDLISEVTQEDKCRIIERFIQVVGHVIEYAQKPSGLVYMVSILDGTVTIRIAPSEQWIIKKKELLTPIETARKKRNQK